ncbi:MAG TPA: ATP-binding protein [Dermatophilaceae bacterium]|nr:ATP-binding protein [Dermatophilaceae bacterium]
MSLTEPVLVALRAIEAGATASGLETDRLDFKTVGRSLDDALGDLAEAAACFANAQGGQIVVGVADRTRGPAGFVGTTLDVTRTQRRLYELTTPSLIVTVAEERWGEARLVVVTAPRSPDVHQVKGKATERVGASCEQMSATRIASVVAERRGDDWSASESGVRIEAVSARAIEDARTLLREAPDPERPRWAGLSVADLLRRLGLVTKSGSLTNAGALLFAADDARPLVSYAHRRTRSGELTINQVLPGPGLTAMLRCFELINTRLDRTPINLPNGQQLFIADLPDLALREAVVNAFMHRDYQSTGIVQIEHSPTRLSVTSPGAFVLGVTPENILTVSSRSRNTALSDAIRQLGLAETAGVGVDRMYAEMARVGHQPPSFESDNFRVSVTLNGGAPNASVTRFVTTLPPERRSDPDTLLVMLALLGRRTVTAEQLATTLQKDSAEVEIVLQHLVAPPVELIERTRESANLKAGVYRLRDRAIAALGTAVTYRRRLGDDTDRKIIDVVRELGQVNSKVVRTMLDVDTPTASRILADLVERRLLTKTSTAERGPSVTYGPGSEFRAGRPDKAANPRRGNRESSHEGASPGSDARRRD